jgi:hypothetical protein
MVSFFDYPKEHGIHPSTTMVRTLSLGRQSIQAMRRIMGNYVGSCS